MAHWRCPVNELADTNSNLNEAAKKVLPRRRFFNDMPDRGLFAVAAVGGSVGIFFLKTSGYPADHVAMIAVAAMLIYGFIAYQIPLVKIQADRLGDNFYYLGFIYTLASLSAALVQLTDEVDVHPLLGSFGIALVTTIVGVAGRVLLLQLRTGLDDIEQKTRQELQATATHLREQLGQSILEFQTFRTSLFQVLEETQEKYAKLITQQIEQSDKLIQEMTKQGQQIKELHDRHTKALAAALQRINKSVENLTQRLASMELPSERLEADLKRFSSNLQDLIVELSRTFEEFSQRSGRKKRWWRLWR